MNGQQQAERRTAIEGLRAEFQQLETAVTNAYEAEAEARMSGDHYAVEQVESERARQLELVKELAVYVDAKDRAITQLITLLDERNYKLDHSPLRVRLRWLFTGKL